MAEDNKIVLKVQVEQGGSTVTLKNFENQVIKSGVAIKDLSNSIGNFTASKLKMDGKVKVTTDQFKRLEKSVGGFKTATGASTSATLELGRVLSDMPYGIRGVANNLQQLASNLFFMSKATDAATGKSVGFGGALKNLIGGLIGPAGILIAFQGIIAAFDYFSGGAEKASNSSSDFKEDLDDLVTTLDNLSISQSNTNDKILEYIEYRTLAAKSDEELKELTEELADLDEEIATNKRRNSEFELNFSKKTKGITLEQYKALSEQEKLEVRRVAQMSNLTATIGDYERGVIKVSELEIKRIETYNNSVNVIKKLREEQDKLTAAEEGTLEALKESKKEFEKKREVLSKTSKDYKRLSKDIDEVQKKIEAIEGKKGKGSVKKISPFKTPKELELDVKNNEAALLAFAKKTELQLLKNKESEELNAAKTEEQRSIIKKRYARLALIAQIENEKKVLLLKKETEKAILQGKYDTFQEEAELRRLAYIDTINKSKLTEKQKEEAIKKANADTAKLTTAAFKEQQAELGEGGVFETRWKATLKAFDALTEARLKFNNAGKLDKEETDLEKWARYAEGVKEIISGISSFADMEFDRQMTIEQNKTNALNNELNKRLLNENLSKEQKEAIQNQIAQNDEKLRVKQEKIARKKFKVMKAFNLATALADTYLSAQKAYLSQLQYDPTSPIRAKIAAGIALAGGLANVAAIARTKFESSSGTSPRIEGFSGGSSSERAEPSFNIVGRSNDNILMSAIQSQFDQPLRAYVVARDVTNQQQLDGVISGAAST